MEYKSTIITEINILCLLLCSFLISSCGDDDKNEELGDDVITRVQDGNGKAFLENGELVDATLDFTQQDLENAISSYEWERAYGFYYDNHKIGQRIEFDFMPVYIHSDFTMQYTNSNISTRIRELSVVGRQLTSILNNPISSTYMPDQYFTVVALDIDDGKGRMIMDCKYRMEVEGYSKKSLAIRLVWYTKDETQTP